MEEEKKHNTQEGVEASVIQLDSKNLPIIKQDRQDLIETAVRFLKNPKVVPTPIETKRLFLEKKGLSTSEIESSLQKAGAYEISAQASSQIQLENQISPIKEIYPVNARPQVVVKKTSWLWRLFKWARNLIIAGCLAYTAYKKFVEHHLFPSKPTKSVRSQRLVVEHEPPDKFAEPLKDMRNALGSLKETVEMMSEAVRQMNAQRMTASVTVPSTSATTFDDSAIRAELQSIKSLLLSRSQFPALPATSPVLPSWQLEKPNSQNGSVKENKSSGSEAEEETSVEETTTKEVNNNVNGDDEPVKFSANGRSSSELIMR